MSGLGFWRGGSRFFGAVQASGIGGAGGWEGWCGLGNVPLVRGDAWLPKKVCAVFRLFNAAPRRFEVEIG